MSWEPLLRDTDAAAREAIDAIARDLKTPREPSERHRPWEEALLFAYRALDSGDREDRQTCADLLDQTREQLPDTGWLHGGLVGVGWAVAHVQSLGVVSGHEDLLEAIDEAVLADLDVASTEGFDLIGGLAGVGIYALERWPSPTNAAMLAQVVRQLSALSEPAGAGVAWRTPLELIPPTKPRPADGYFDLGVAHGGPGVLAALEGAVRRGVEQEQAAALRDGLLRWLTARLLPEQDTLPAFVGDGIEPSMVRLAWCYGDAGVAGAVSAVSEHDLAGRLARASAGRPADATGIVDPMLCHGSAGLGHIMTRLAQRGHAACRQAAVFWLQDTLRRRGAGGHGGFQSWSPAKQNAVADPGFLSGSAGVGLALLAAVARDEPAWDRLLGLSVR